jgi:hypothetical protein
MKPFAKLYETERGQILVLRQPADETGNPEVRYFFDPGHPSLSVCSVAFSFADSDAGHLVADEAFAAVDQAAAERAVFSQMDAIARMFDGGEA